MAELPKPPLCSDCKVASTLVTGEVIYPHRRDLSERVFWKCPSCHSWVGCHLPAAAGGQGDGTVPLVTLANAELRRWRNSVHALLDPIWKGGSMRRSEAYRWLAQRMRVPTNQCHVSYFDVVTCKRAVQLLAARED